MQKPPPPPPPSMLIGQSSYPPSHTYRCYQACCPFFGSRVSLRLVASSTGLNQDERGPSITASDQGLAERCTGKEKIAVNNSFQPTDSCISGLEGGLVESAHPGASERTFCWPFLQTLGLLKSVQPACRMRTWTDQLRPSSAMKSSAQS